MIVQTARARATKQFKRQGGSALSWVILGTPALICFGMWVYKHDREVFAPMRNERRLQAARAAYELGEKVTSD